MIATVFIGTISAEFSNDACGRRRNPEDWTDYIFATNTEKYSYLLFKVYNVSKSRDNNFPREQRTDTWSFWSSVFYLNWFFTLSK
jgi:hypothetical protein